MLTSLPYRRGVDDGQQLCNVCLNDGVVQCGVDAMYSHQVIVPVDGQVIVTELLPRTLHLLLKRLYRGRQCTFNPKCHSLLSRKCRATVEKAIGQDGSAGGAIIVHRLRDLVSVCLC